MRKQPDTAPVPAHAAINDCWNKIGVWGDGSCPELIKHVHCRNCPVYSTAAVELLNGEIPEGYLAEWTNHFAREKTVTGQDTHSVVIFRIGVEWLALPVEMFKEVSEMKRVHSLPHRRSKVVLGLANIRGELLVCVSLAEVLGVDSSKETRPGTNRDSHPYMLVISHEGHRLVFPVDEVAGIHRFSMKTVKVVPVTVSKAMSTYTTGILPWQEKSVGCLDGALLFYTLNKGLS